MPNHEYEVFVGNVGCVYTGNNKREASGVYSDYVKVSRHGAGRAADEPVSLFMDGEPIREYAPRECRCCGAKGGALQVSRKGGVRRIICGACQLVQ